MSIKKTIVLSLGGSLIVPQGIDTEFLKKFRAFILGQVQSGHRFIIISGGGSVCREYQRALKSVFHGVSSDNIDWLGIHVTRVNAQLLRLLFGKVAHPRIIEDPNNKVVFKEKILIAGGWKPGRSTDDDAVRLAKAYGATTIVNLSNIDYVYTKDPRKFTNAQIIQKMSWQEFIKTFGSKWRPGLHTPFDPVAARDAQKNHQRVIITNGTNLKNLANILTGKKFKGTVLE